MRTAAGAGEVVLGGGDAKIVSLFVACTGVRNVYVTQKMPKYHVITDHKVALESPDHLHPWGTAQDNSQNLNFNSKLFRLVGRPRVLDLGCAGGGFVKSILDQGGEAVGLEGSDYSLMHRRAEWATLAGKNLFTADITRPFRVLKLARPTRFNVITAWEVLEHIAEADLPVLFDNVRRHASAGAYLIASINTQDDAPLAPDGYSHHQTVRDRGWWLEWLMWKGWYHEEGLYELFWPDVVRGGPAEPSSFVFTGRRAESG